ncbi:hypothetical protein [Ruegeria sp. HKCCA5929]|uniref:hypothetical protein n=1 Tax=Ruegeria sp. HKCCA5929 TaxID=2682988 RepID=UPI001488E65D|nr:hypothetical protein [Ruegeria sp. HKCCA5929]
MRPMILEQKVIYSRILRHLSTKDYSGARKYVDDNEVSKACGAADFADLLMHTANSELDHRSPAEVTLGPGGVFLLNRTRPWE